MQITTVGKSEVFDLKTSVLLTVMSVSVFPNIDGKNTILWSDMFHEEINTLSDPVNLHSGFPDWIPGSRTS